MNFKKEESRIESYNFFSKGYKFDVTDDEISINNVNNGKNCFTPKLNKNISRQLKGTGSLNNVTMFFFPSTSFN